MENYRPPIHFDSDIERAYASALSRLSVDRLGASARERLTRVLTPECVELIFAHSDADALELREGCLERSDEWLSDVDRVTLGAFFTPKAVADRMASEIVGAGRVLDPSCGGGELLLAVFRVSPETRLVGVEWNPLFAYTAALRLLLAGARDFRVVWGDGLDAGAVDSPFDAVITNPPYLGEKGRKSLFDSIRERHPELGERFTARMDLSYLFVHRSLDHLEGGTLVLLSSEYWLTADSASTLRDRLIDQAPPRLLIRLGGGVFSSAPGHHSLIYVGEAGSNSAVAIDDERFEFVPEPGRTWHPFTSALRSDYEEWPRLGTLVRDQQGFVSGLDRTSRRRHAPCDGDQPGFIWRAEELSEFEQSGRGAYRPLIRASECEPNRVHLRAPASDYVLWLDEPISAENEQVLPTELSALRRFLERRRESAAGTMPWYRLHWPRRRRDHVGPKLVVPRRATRARFSLDLSASHVSSDCTYLIPMADQHDAMIYLITLMVCLNSERVAEYLRHFGKKKGEIIEFYSRPLRDLPVPARLVEGRLEPLFQAERLILDELLRTLHLGDHRGS